MKVKALHSITEYYTLESGKIYDVHGIVYFATPFFSHESPTSIDSNELRGLVNPVYSYGVIRNELVYIIEEQTVTGRKTLSRFNAANFEVVDATIPMNWSTTTIDLYKEVLQAQKLFEEHGNAQSSQFTEPLKALRAYNAQIIVTGDKKLHSFEYLQKVCDDDLDEEW